MNFANYADFRTKVQQLIDGDDVSQSSLSVSILDLLIATGERDLYRSVRSSTQEAALSITVTNNAAPLPADFLELKGSPYIGNGRATARFLPAQQLQDGINLNTNTLTSGPIYYSFRSDTMIFYPPQATGIVITGTYYKKFADISGGTLNALFVRHPDLFLYAALAKSAPYVGEIQRLPVWQQEYSSIMSDVNEEERRRITRGSKLQTRVG